MVWLGGGCVEETTTTTTYIIYKFTIYYIHDPTRNSGEKIIKYVYIHYENFNTRQRGLISFIFEHSVS